MEIGYIGNYAVKLLEFSNTYTTGSLQSYSMPCIGYLTEGMGIFFCEGKTYYAHKGDLIYIAKDTKYYSVWYGEPRISFYSVSFDFTQPYSFYDYRFQIVRGVNGTRFKEMCENYPTHYMRSAQSAAITAKSKSPMRYKRAMR